MKILHFSAECYPVAKVGGLADVVGALPKYQNLLKHKSQVIMPFYKTKFVQHNHFKKELTGTISMGQAIVPFDILKLTDTDLGFDVFLVRIPGLLDRENVYAYPDDTERFIAFQKAALDWVLQLKKKPDIIHCHDHHSGLIPFMVSHAVEYDELKKIPTVLTIHNAQYQGYFAHDKLNLLPYFDQKHIGLLDWNHAINPLAAAIKCAQRVTTVSQSYLEEMTMSANGLEWLLQHHRDKCMGILNGIDTKVWDPGTDIMLNKKYTVTTIAQGKKANKAFLCKEFDLDPAKPLFAFIGRLVYEKGADLFPPMLTEVLPSLSDQLNILILGSGDSQVEAALTNLKYQFKGSYNVFVGYDEPLSHIIYGGADFLLMPSRVEPCGLNQMYSLRYGTIPIVRRTGGLKDTIIDIGDDGFGICHDQPSVWDIQYSIKRALILYKDQKKFSAIRKKIMKIDHSWENQASKYIDLYKSLTP